MRIRAALASAALVALSTLAAQSAEADVPACLRVLAPLAVDAIAATDAFTPADCAGEMRAPFHFDRAGGVTRLARALAPGDIVPRYPEYGIAMVRPGQVLKLVVAVGAVRIERDVEAMQPARPGQHLFVKSQDGQIISVLYESGTP